MSQILLSLLLFAFCQLSIGQQQQPPIPVQFSRQNQQPQVQPQAQALPSPPPQQQQQQLPPTQQPQQPQQPQQQQQLPPTQQPQQQQQQQRPQQQVAPTPTPPQVDWGFCPELNPTEDEKVAKGKVVQDCLSSTPTPTNVTRESVEDHRMKIAQCALTKEDWFDANGKYKFEKAATEIRRKRLHPQIEQNVLRFHTDCQQEAQQRFPQDSQMIQMVSLYQACMDFRISEVCNIRIIPPTNINAGQQFPPGNINAGQQFPPGNNNAGQFPPGNINAGQFPPENFNGGQQFPPENFNGGQQFPPGNFNGGQPF